MVAPLQHHHAASRALALFFATPPPFDEGTRATLRTFASHAAIALDNQRLMEEKEHMAVRDGLTDVFNRGYLELALERAAKEARRNGGEVSVLFVDVDGMKDVNDTFGHRAGDSLLIELGRLLQGSCRETDVVARYGGDEFVVLMPSTGADGAAEVERKVARAIAAHDQGGGGPRLSASLGTSSTAAEGVPTLLQEADRRMYGAKRARRAGRQGWSEPGR
jgi:diguanylate cyclase (GGDEF)-like protein